MQTNLPLQLLETTAGKQADSILRACVHCGFCTATCPTYLLTGNELDSPRGRIYLVKELLESGHASQTTRTHLDRCLSCQACESTCPSNVDYHTLLNIGRAVIEQSVSETWFVKLKRKCLLHVLGTSSLFAFMVKLGLTFRKLLPNHLAQQLPGESLFPSANTKNQAGQNSRKVVLLNGCVQGSLSPDTNLAATQVLNQLGINTISIQQESCCGAMHYHSSEQEAGLNKARQLIDQMLKELASGAEAIISTASGCGNFIKDYQKIFRDDEEYQHKAQKMLNAVNDISEFLSHEDLGKLQLSAGQSLAFHSPCTLQHGQQLSDAPEKILRQLGFTLPVIENAHLCCGSAGTYSLLQPTMSKQLRDNKIMALEASGAGNIATANIGCQCHLAGATEKKVKHWIEFIAEASLPDKSPRH